MRSRQRFKRVRQCGSNIADWSGSEMGEGYLFAIKSQLCLDYLMDSLNKIRGRTVIDRNYDRSGQEPAPEGYDPFDTILSPDDYPVAFGDPLFGEPCSQGRCVTSETFIRVVKISEAVVIDD